MWRRWHHMHSAINLPNYSRCVISWATETSQKDKLFDLKNSSALLQHMCLLRKCPAHNCHWLISVRWRIFHWVNPGEKKWLTGRHRPWPSLSLLTQWGSWLKLKVTHCGVQFQNDFQHVWFKRKPNVKLDYVDSRRRDWCVGWLISFSDQSQSI